MPWAGPGHARVQRGNRGIVLIGTDLMKPQSGSRNLVERSRARWQSWREQINHVCVSHPQKGGLQRRRRGGDVLWLEPFNRGADGAQVGGEIALNLGLRSEANHRK